MPKGIYMQTTIETSPMTEAELREWARIEAAQEARQNIIGQNGNDGDHYDVKPKKYTNLMIDIETLSTKPNGAIVSIGAAFFDINTGHVGPTFNEQICPVLSHTAGFVEDKATVEWWEKQSMAAKAASLMGEKHPREALIALTEYIQAHAYHLPDLRVWANGPRFDLVMLQHHFEHYGMELPWHYYNERDVRTYRSVGFIAGAQCGEHNKGVKHTALDDALHQISIVTHAHSVINDLIKDSNALAALFKQGCIKND